MTTHADLAQEEGILPALCDDGLPPPELDGVDFAILSAWTEKRDWKLIAGAVGIGLPTLKSRISRPIFRDALERLRKSLFDQLARGEFGALAYVKSNLIENLRMMQGLARAANDEKTRFSAQKQLIEYAGMQPSKPQEGVTIERVLDEMTPEELHHFHRTNEFPRRLADRLARVAASELKQRDATVIEATDVTIEPLLPPEHPMPKEVIEDDLPVWDVLPDDDRPESAFDPPPPPEKRKRRTDGMKGHV